MKILTLTLSPAFDLHCCADTFRLCHENYAEVTAFHAGGKGINISRALHVSGVENLALVAVGEENGAAFLRQLRADGVCYESVAVKGRIRENITIHAKNGDETRLSFKGFSVGRDFIKAVRSLLSRFAEKDAILTFTGRLPDGADKKAVITLIREWKEKGCKCVIDSKSFSRADLLACQPWLIKPNQEEIAEYAGEKADSMQSAVQAAEKLRQKGIENVMISLGEKGAILASPSGCFAARAPEIRVISTIGAGDSSIAGFIAAYTNQKGADACLRTAVAYGSAACLQNGTLPPKKSDIEKIYAAVSVEAVPSAGDLP